jgi:valyl-tRNA synthetase
MVGTDCLADHRENLAKQQKGVRAPAPRVAGPSGRTAFAVTVKSMSEELAKAYDPSAIEEKWAKYWVEERVFDVPSASGGKKPFTILLPPPNVTGRLHMGHMFEQAETDILIRWRRMSGDQALWVPGTDHAGIATQMMVEKQLASEGATRQAIGREAFLERVWAWKNQYGGAITDQMRRLGASVDWSREYFTMDAGLSTAVVEAFVRLWEQGLIYRGAYIVNWDPIIQTAVSDLEVESEERLGKLYYIRYPLDEFASEFITIATTRPETMLGDVAIAVNPNDERYRHLIGCMARLPLTTREIPILADNWANPEFGTGAVKVTPAHDANDFAIGQRHNLPNLSILDKTARIDLPGSPFHGKDRFEARELIVAQLDSIGLLEKIKDHPMTVPVSQRSGAVIEPRLSNQWFLAVNKTPANGGGSIAGNAIAAVRDGHIRIQPEMYEKTYFEWMGNIHDWCFSRQLWWGHRIPAWYCDACGEFTVARTTPTHCGKCANISFTQETDVLDTWFSSGLLPFTVFGWPHTGAAHPPEDPAGTLHPKPYTLNPDLASFYPTDLLITGFDILFFWVARMIMLGAHFMLDIPMPDGSQRKLAEAVPFRQVYIHALIRDADRQKMSKTKGNVIDPIGIISRFGTDAVRFTLASMASPGTDIAFSEARTEGYRAFANKIWNSARFVFMNVERAKEAGIEIDLATLAWALKSGSDNYLESRWIRSQLSTVAGGVNLALSEYRFDEAANLIYQFFWGDFCDWYLELVKLRLDFTDQPGLPSHIEALRKLLAVFEASLRLLSPFMPFLTEEIWHALYRGKPAAKSIALTAFPLTEEARYSEADVADMELLKELIVSVRSLRKDLGVPEKELAPVKIYIGESHRWLLEIEYEAFARLGRVRELEFAEQSLHGANTKSTATFDVQVVYERQIDVAAERERLTKDLAKYQKGLQAAEKQLGNEAFIARAPAPIVEGLKKQAAETRLLYEKALAALQELESL